MAAYMLSFRPLWFDYAKITWGIKREQLKQSYDLD